MIQPILLVTPIVDVRQDEIARRRPLEAARDVDVCAALQLDLGRRSRLRLLLLGAGGNTECRDPHDRRRNGANSWHLPTSGVGSCEPGAIPSTPLGTSLRASPLLLLHRERLTRMSLGLDKRFRPIMQNCQAFAGLGALPG